eukprot:GDKJ01042841.1.p1 GENE.GDKJ01042841.1~~GDKJ01042841.1.p1  ORF type:complete len:200 (-),score=26.91 GDKJ01042841.1:75-587(-)
MNHRYMQDSTIPVPRLVDEVGSKHQRNIQNGSRRPYGVGLLIGGYDRQGAHLIQTSPSGDIYDYKATAMGARSQSARTYLEKHFTTFSDASLDEIVVHALKALSSTAAENVKLNTLNTTIAIVGRDCPFAILTDDEARKYLDNLVIRAEDIAQDEDEDDNADGEPEDLDE